MRNISINVTLPADAVSYIDERASGLYLSRATVARQLIIEHIEEEKVIIARRKGFSIRKVSEITGVRYDKVLEIIRRAGIDEEQIDAGLESYMDNVVGKIKKQKR